MDCQVTAKDGVTAPLGFTAAGIAAGVKKVGHLDMALLVSENPATAAAAFTSNQFAAAPVQYGRTLFVTDPLIRAVIVNSGNANACTGAQGLNDTRQMAARTAACLGCKSDEVMVSSTGRIGVPLPMPVIMRGIESAVESLEPTGGAAAAEAIMTTDTRPKTGAVSFAVDGCQLTVGGMAKGAGMIAPQMVTAGPHATMLAYITTDAAVESRFLHECLNSALAHSFNKITVDGDMSTNDTVLVLANGRAGNEPISHSHPAAEKFRQAIHDISEKMARDIVLDAEGATKFVEVKVSGARDMFEARACADTIANSLLCKTAWFGNDSNWGRVLDAAGYAAAEIDTRAVALDYNQIPVVRNGISAGTDEAVLAQTMQNKELTLELNLGTGQAAAVVWTCDLSYDYVKINAAYTAQG